MLEQQIDKEKYLHEIKINITIIIFINQTERINVIAAAGLRVFFGGPINLI